MTTVNPAWRRPTALGAAIVAILAACALPPSKDDVEAAKNTYGCQMNGERLVVRFAPGEARLLMPDGNRVNLYQIPAGPGMRYSNGLLELRGRGTDLQLTLNGVAVPVVGCEQFPVPQ